jgi:hypothetical protein
MGPLKLIFELIHYLNWEADKNQNLGAKELRIRTEDIFIQITKEPGGGEIYSNFT